MTTHADAAIELERHAQDIAQAACKTLLSEHQEIGARFGDDARQVWTEHLNQRVMELSAALAVGDDRLFASRLAWSRVALQARNMTADDLRTSLLTLRDSIDASLQNGAGQLARDCIDRALLELDTIEVPATRSRLDAGIECDRLALQYVQTVVAGNVFPGMQLVLDAVSHGLPIRDAYIKVLLPAQAEVGRLWHLNEISVSEEHLVSYTTQRLMALLSSRMPRKPDNGYTAIAGAVAGNIHDIGIRAIAYLLEFEGWRTIYLGSDIPRLELPATVESYQADVVLLSLALTSQLTATRRAIKGVREECHRNVKILVGGNGLSEKPDLWKDLGADGYAADAATALELAYELASQH